VLSATTEAPQPLLKGDATVLWTTVGGFLFIFFVVIFLIMRMNAKAVARHGRGGPPGDFFQPAGEGAEITFDDEAAEAPTQSGESALSAERAPAKNVQTEKTPEKSKKKSGGGLFGGRRSKDAQDADANDEASQSTAEPPAPPRAHPLAQERRLQSETAAHGAATDGSVKVAERGRSAPVLAARFGEDEAARARRQVEEEFRRIEEERRAAAERNEEFNRSKQMAALDQERRTIEAREHAVAEKAGALERQIGDLRRDLADELDARFGEIASEFDSKLTRFAAEVSAPAAVVSDAEASIRVLENRFAALSQDFEQKLAGGASSEQVSAIAGLVARRIGEESDALNASIAALSKRLDALAAQLPEIETLRSELAALRRAVPAPGAGAGAPTIQLSDILRDALPPGAFEMRVLLSNNRRADCVVKLPYPPGPIAVDAQFPVDAFQQIEFAPQAESELRRAALRHIADVAERLISPGETADSALLFIPSEAVYAALHARFPDVIQDSYRAHVWIVSPTTLMAALHTMRAVLRDAPGPGDAGAHDGAAGAELSALAARVSALEAAVTAAVQTAPGKMEKDEAGPSLFGEFPDAAPAAFEPEAHAHSKDSSKGDLWDDDQSTEGSASPFPLR
jgi:DNA recombination protein RmuC